MVTNLIPGQYQFGDLVMGKGTPYKITAFDINPYGVAVQDYQLPLSDENNFGLDTQTPGPINLTINVIQNRWLENMPPPEPGATLISGSLSDLQREWRADDVRSRWGEMKPLYYCGNDGIIKAIYGRPGKFQYPKGNERSEVLECTGEFRRADNFSHVYRETVVELQGGAAPVWIKSEGDAAAFGRIYMVGPLSNPIVSIGDQTYQLQLSLASGEAAEVSGYPWRRRAVNSNGINIRANLDGKLDKLKIPSHTYIPVRWTSDNINTIIPSLNNRSWYQDIDDLNYHNLPDTFTTIGGKVVLRLDILNPEWFSQYLCSGILGKMSACIYNKNTFATLAQYTQATLVEPYNGRSGLCIMSNPNMTNYLMLEVVAGWGNNKLNIRVGGAWNTWSAPVATWTNPSGWSETDQISIEYDIPTNRFIGKLNGVEKLGWIDSTNLVSKNIVTNNCEAFVFDMDDTILFTQGVGFKDIVAYDKLTTAAPVGDVFVLWRDAYQVIG